MCVVTIPILGTFLTFLHSVFHFFLHEQFQKLLFADVAVGVAVDLREDALDTILGLLPL